ncbi:FAD/NAD(P)-binding domain-containing protein [Calocera viscosa TUFC12733]|uniref:FAD/NAD(P)-binding domain-containing protein n=1 Tax=Calocera viscosa (strain TUFC12733) TaxID=1330018 RepID=A0A167G5X0_CALVF|nr:FAD/NAD(P)-binding domain-containing protein [Calocera viscosa TUFC12733]
MPPNHAPRIAVIGGGPAGLTFASVLLHQLATAPAVPFTPSITLFERDTAHASRDLGGTLDLHGATGQRALHFAGLWEKFVKIARYEGQEIKMLDKTGKVWLTNDEKYGGPPPGVGDEGASAGGAGPRGSDEDGRPEIDRGILNSLLIDSLPESTIQWGKAVTALERSASGTHKLTFSDGTSSEFDLVIGGDGAWSKTRHLLTPIAPYYSGMTMVEVRLSGVDSRIPHIGALVGQGMLMAFSDNGLNIIVGQRNFGERVRVYFTLRCAETWQKDSGIDWRSVAAARPGIRALFADWDRALLDLLDLCDAPAGEAGIAVRPLYMLPPDDFRWPHSKGVTLIGDAAHLMTPSAGEGANIAMADAADLALALVDAFRSPSPTAGEDPLDEAVKAYEEQMFPLAEASMKRTLDNMNMFMSADTPDRKLAFMRRVMRIPEEGKPAVME